MTRAEDSLLDPLGPEDPQEISGYRLLAKVGEGGMGAVYLSRTRGNQPVALKVIRREFAQDSDFRARFEREVLAASRVSGYHIVPVLDHDVDGKQPWIATSYIPGLALDDALSRFGPLPLAVTFQLIGCTAQALSAVHAASVIHRDLKPSNILLSSNGPWVIDFGIARATDATQLTQTGGFIGTPQYMSPEHALGKTVTPATDIFALGLIAAVVATGRHPYGDGAGISIAATIANTDQRPPDLSGYPQPLREMLAGCLTADPLQRPEPGALANWCEQASGRARRDFSSWLPAPLTKEITGREQASRRPPQASSPPVVGAPGTAADHAPARPAAAPPAYAPTQASAEAPPAAPTPAYAAPTQATAPTTPTPGSGPADSKTAGSGPSFRRRRRLMIGGAVVATAVAGMVIAMAPGSGDSATTKSKDRVGSAPSPGAKAPAQAGYRPAFEGKPISLRYPSTSAGFTSVDLDVPAQDENGGQGRQIAGQDTELRQWPTEIQFRTTFGKSLGVTPQECSHAAKSKPMPGNLVGAQLGGADAISQGDLLCTVTSKGNLALLKITDVVKDRDAASREGGAWGGITGYAGEVTLWKPVAE
ncbi:serine/threonine-protein kinase [Streptomyces piniterrae]|uniref:serine/threonine-protein kinase n=1 Tax=Streptomyces piniterrae TaxID=2571125 RepID=UPI001FE7F8D5|nr:serine/threonine-protein kinase [Streptomyces piniterrae]